MENSNNGHSLSIEQSIKVNKNSFDRFKALIQRNRSLIRSIKVIPQKRFCFKNEDLGKKNKKINTVRKHNSWLLGDRQHHNIVVIMQH